MDFDIAFSILDCKVMSVVNAFQIKGLLDTYMGDLGVFWGEKFQGGVSMN